MFGYCREVFLSHMEAAQGFRLSGLLFESLAAIEQARNARLSLPSDTPSFPETLKTETLFSTLWVRGMARAGYRKAG
jgi:hypothetical protein